MPFFTRSSSFCFLACLCAAGVAYSQQPLSYDRDLLPFFDKGSDFYLTNNFCCQQVYGAGFPSSFLGSNSSFSLLGKGHKLAFIECQAPMGDSTLLEASSDLNLSNFSLIEFRGNVSSSKKGLIHGETISLTNIGSAIFDDNTTHYVPATTSPGTATPPPDVTVEVCAGSVIQAETTLTISGIRKELSFSNNSASFGAAILLSKSADKCCISNNAASITFSGNVASCGGGAIYSSGGANPPGHSVTFSNNTGKISFFGNTVQDSLASTLNPPQPTPPPTPPTTTFDPTAEAIANGCGGAISVPAGKVEFIGNSQECGFRYNLAKSNGGAIYATEVSLDLESSFIALKNTARGKGGAICAKKLTLTTNGDVTFDGNRATQGGAIYLDETIGAGNSNATAGSGSGSGGAGGSNGTPSNSLSALILEAKGGSITFINNMDNLRPGVRNAIYLGKSTLINGIDAYGLNKIVFHDPLVQSNTDPVVTTTTTPTTGNNPNVKINGHGSGDVIFTAETLSAAEKVNSENYTSKILGTVTVGGGRLFVTEGAALNVGSLNATTGELVLGSGAAIGSYPSNATTANPTDPLVTVSGKLGIDVDSFMNPNFSKAAINGTLTINPSATIDIVTKNEAELYDNPLLATSLAIPFVQAQTSSITTAPLSPEVAEHYGYQGEWKSETSLPVLAPTPAGKIPENLTVASSKSGIYVVWRPDVDYKATYKLDPRRRGELVPNSLWCSFSAMQTFSQGLRENVLSEHEGIVTSLNALGNYAFAYVKGNREGFSQRFGGYQAIASMHYGRGSLIGVAFGQLYGQLLSRPFDTKSAGHITMLSCFGTFPVFTENAETIVGWEGCYGYFDNRMKSTYFNPISDTNQVGKGRWHNNSYYMALSAEHDFLQYLIPTRGIGRRLGLMGFAKAEVAGGWQNVFTESGALPRHFSRGKGYNVSLPIGIYGQGYSPFKRLPSLSTFKVAYRPDIFRVIPHNVMTIVANGEQTAIQGANLARNSLLLEMNNSFFVHEIGAVFVNYSMDIKNSYTNYRLVVGMNGRF